MLFFEKKVSEFIENQFPAVYREEGPVFVEFVKAYYEWMESSNNSTYHARRLLEYRDVDSTVDEFVKHFKYKYLNNIQFDTAVDTATIVKHSLDLYRSKGTERSIDLFFKYVFGIPATVYFPSKDIFRASSGKWIEPKYLEIEPFEDITDFVGYQIEGLDSGAIAFVEKYVRKSSYDSAIVHEVLFISSIVGSFRTGERIRKTIDQTLGPLVIGSMNDLTVVTSSSGYAVGDVVDISSNNVGRNGTARVTEIETTSGKVSFTLENGGWGYNSNSQLIIAEKMLIVANLTNSANTNKFQRFETVVQPLINLHYTTLTGNAFAVGQTVYRQIVDGANTTYVGAPIVSINVASNTEGYLLLSTAAQKFDLNRDVTTEDSLLLTTENGFTFVTEDEGLTSDDLIYNANTDDVATIDTYTDLTASANVMKYSSNVTIEMIDSTTRFVDGEEVFQYSNSMVEVANAYVDTVSYFGTNATMRLSNVHGSFENGNVYSRTTAATGNAVSIVITVGLFNVDNDFYDADTAPIYGLSSNTYGIIDLVSLGSGANLSVSNTYDYVETIAINIDVIGDYLTLQLDASDYGFPASGVETLSTTLANALSYNTEDYGRITSIVVTNSGEDYNFSPYAVVYEKDLYAYNKKNFVVYVSNVVGAFEVGEAVQQSSDNVGIVLPESNSSVLYLQRVTFGDISDAGTLTGATSGTTADVDAVYEDEHSEPIGIDALIVANTTTTDGAVVSLSVTDSGFGYYDGELVTFSMSGNEDTGTALVGQRTHGSARGYHKENNSVLSGNKYLQDGRYYQEFSYEVRSAKTLEKYSEMLKNVIHVAGTELFAKFVDEATANVEISFVESSVATGVAT